MFALVDVNNFYVSCECVFQPKLENVPMVVLSNNDECTVARSTDVKAFDVKMPRPKQAVVNDRSRAVRVATSIDHPPYN